MWVAPEHAVSDPEQLRRLVRDYPFATLHSASPHGQLASHLPIVPDPTAPVGEAVTTRLIGHMARANEHWKAMPDDTPVLAIFTGPHAYITPDWYGPGPGTPTWNYTAVHLHGRITLVDDTDEALRIIRFTIAALEHGREPEWDPTSSADLHRKLIAGTRAFRIDVDRHEAIFKLSGNKPLEVQQSVRDALAASSTGADRDLAAFMNRERPLRVDTDQV
jgi:transcriptional regulator